MESELHLESFSKYLLIGLLYLAIIGLPLSLFRFYDIGFQPVFVAHLLISCAVFVMYYYRKTIHHRTVILFTCLVFTMIALGGISNFGLISNFLIFTNITSLIVTIYFGVKFGLIFMVFFLITVTLFAYLYIHGILVYPVDLNIYATSYNAWLLVLVGGVISNFLLLVAINNMQNQLKNKINALHAERKKAEYWANHDSLTGLSSLRLSCEKIEMAISLAKRTNRKVALMFIDLDGFKLVNDTHGHDAGDSVLIQIAHRINNIIRNSDTTCRVGGDEFLIALPNIEDIKQVEQLCIRLLEEIKKPVNYNDIPLCVSASIGISIYPDDAQDFKALKKSADRAMYEIKKSGKCNYMFANNNKYE